MGKSETTLGAVGSIVVNGSVNGNLSMFTSLMNYCLSHIPEEFSWFAFGYLKA
jgi:hypothetical protein